MENDTYDVAEEKTGFPRLARMRLGVISTVLVIVMMIVLYDFSDFKGKIAGCFFSSRHAYGEKVDDGERSATSENEDTDQGRDIVVTKKDLQKAYKDLLQEKKEEVEKVKLFEADKGSYYQIDLINGRTLTAVTIQLDKKMALITDEQGMTINISRQEIVGINKVDGKANGRKKK